MLARRSRIHKRQGSKWDTSTGRGALFFTMRPVTVELLPLAVQPARHQKRRAAPSRGTFVGRATAEQKKTVKIPAMQTNTHHRHFIRHKIILELVRSGNANGDLEFAVRECSEPKKIPKPQMPPKRQ
jgi:hypothetical protein